MGNKNKRIDLVGKTYGNWKVLSYAGGMKWLCECSCGTTREVYGSSLRQGKSTSCGHEKYTPTIDITGRKFGDLEVKKYITDGKWECECSCGNTKIVRGYDLTNGSIKTCGHTNINREKLIGITYGAWKVLSLSEDTRQVSCECECGTIRDVSYYTLLNGTSTNCGCRNEIDLVGKRFGEWLVLEKLGSGEWLCKCTCGTVSKQSTSNLTLGRTQSCGCKANELKAATMLERYNEIATSRITNPREIDQIQASYSKEAMIETINNLEHKADTLPSLKSLADKLGISVQSTGRILRKYDIDNLIKSGVYGETENDIALLIESFGIKVVRKSKELIPPLEIDIYIPQYNLAIEFNGTYWHSDIQKEKKYHQNKTIECAKRGIRLIHIFEYEWLDGNKRVKIIELLKTILQPANNNVVYARKTKLTTLEYKDTKEFLNNNHLQGEATASVSIGLKQDGELIALMTFGKPRFNGGYDWELVRLAYKNGTAVVGGAEKMFKYFLKEYKPENIISYCDISKFTGNVYSRLGFTATLTDITEPNYVWVDRYNETIIPRYKAMKHKLVAQELGTINQTEREIMQNQGYLRVYDSGNLRFSWQRNRGFREGGGKH